MPSQWRTREPCAAPSPTRPVRRYAAHCGAVFCDCWPPRAHERVNLASWCGRWLHIWGETRGKRASCGPAVYRYARVAVCNFVTCIATCLCRLYNTCRVLPTGLWRGHLQQNHFAQRCHLNMLEQAPTFFVAVWSHALTTSPRGASILGCQYLGFRAAYVASNLKPLNNIT